MKQLSFSFSHLTGEYVCAHKLKLTLSSLVHYQLDHEKKNTLWIQQHKFQSWYNTMVVNSSVCSHCFVPQHMIQSPFLAWKVILLKVCSQTLAFQTNDLTRLLKTNTGLTKDSQLQDSVCFPSKGDPTLFRLSSFRHKIPLLSREMSNSLRSGPGCRLANSM